MSLGVINHGMPLSVLYGVVGMFALSDRNQWDKDLIPENLSFQDTTLAENHESQFNYSE
jgi:hypothetical protein